MPGPLLPEALSCHAMAMVSSTEVLIAGGRMGGDVSSDRVYLFDAKKEVFVEKARMKLARYSRMIVADC